MVEQAKTTPADADEDDRGRLQVQDMGMPACTASPSSATQAMRKKGNRSPLRARAQQNHETVAAAFASASADADADNFLRRQIVPPDYSLFEHMMMTKKRESDGSAASCANSYTNPTFISKPNSPREHWSSTPLSLRFADSEWERLVANGRESNDGTNLIRLLADFIEEFQFGGFGKGETANWASDSKSSPIESRHSHQLAGQLRKLADAFEKENDSLSLRDRR